MGLTVMPPHLNHSQFKFTVNGDDTVIYGLGAIKGVGESAIEAIIAYRPAADGYRDLFEFCRLVDLRKVNRRVLESLIRAGAMDELGCNRATLISLLPLALKMAEQHHADSAAGQSDLFGLSDPDPVASGDHQVVPDNLDEWEDDIRLQGEKETLGLYLTGHPIDRYLDEFSGLGITQIGSLSLEETAGEDKYRRRSGRRVMVAGLALSAGHRQTQRGTMGALVLDDRSGRIEATLFSEAYETYQELLVSDRILVVVGSLNYDEYRGGLSVRVDQVVEFEDGKGGGRRLSQAEDGLAAARRDGANSVGVYPEAGSDLLSLSQRILRSSGHLSGARSDGHSGVRRELAVGAKDELLRKLRRLIGVERVKVVYSRRLPVIETPAKRLPVE